MKPSVVPGQLDELIADGRDRLTPRLEPALPAADVCGDVLDRGRAEGGQVASRDVPTGVGFVDRRRLHAEPVAREGVLRTAISLGGMRNVDERDERGKVAPRGADDDLRLRPSPRGASHRSRLDAHL